MTWCPELAWRTRFKSGEILSLFIYYSHMKLANPLPELLLLCRTPQNSCSTLDHILDSVVYYFCPFWFWRPLQGFTTDACRALELKILPSTLSSGLCFQSHYTIPLTLKSPLPLLNWLNLKWLNLTWSQGGSWCSRSPNLCHQSSDSQGAQFYIHLQLAQRFLMRHMK